MGLLNRIVSPFLGQQQAAPGSGVVDDELLAAGTPAPDFELPSTDGRLVRLSDLRGRPVVLVFYPADNTPVCTSQLLLYNEAYSMFAAYDAAIFGISVDDPQTHAAFARRLGLHLPLLADHDPAGAVTRAYGAYNEASDCSRRALYVIDHEGVVFWNHLAPIDVNPGAHGILDALRRLDAVREGAA